MFGVKTPCTRISYLTVIGQSARARVAALTCAHFLSAAKVDEGTMHDQIYVSMVARYSYSDGAGG